MSSKKIVKRTVAKPEPTESADQRRRYDSPARRRQIIETKERILSAGSKLAHASPTWNFSDLNSRAIVEESGVGMRTLKRYFPTEKSLRDAIVQRLMIESGIPFEHFKLHEFSDIVRRKFNHLSQYAAEPTTPPITDPSFASIDQQLRNSLLAVVARSTPDWSVRETERIAALLDIIWNQPTLERLTVAWGLDSDSSIQALTWLADLIVDAIEKGERPGKPVKTLK